MEILAIVICLLFLGIALRLMAGAFDGERVERYLRERGAELIDKSWAPFGPGWFAEQESRIYEVVYRDREGRVHRAHVKTSMFSGVYLTNDRIVEDRPPRSIEEEKAELRRRLAELEQE